MPDSEFTPPPPPPPEDPTPEPPSSAPWASVPPPESPRAGAGGGGKPPMDRTRVFLLSVIVLAIAIASASLVYLLLKQKGGEAKVHTQDMQKIEKDYSDLKKKYEELEADRNNVLAQTKTLLQEKAKWEGTGEQLENLKKTNKVFMIQKNKLLEENQRLKNQASEIMQNFDGLKQSYQDLLAKQEASDKENAALRDLLTKQVEATPAYQVLDREVKRLRDENQKLGETINVMEQKLKFALDRIKKDQVRELNMLRQIRGQKEILVSIQSENEVLTKTNRELNDLINQAPARIRDMAQQNQQLVKETAEMHYNMGVFFTENQKYEEAEREYQRALDFDPNNLKVHYNLGYLYAESMEKHDKAMFHLEKYLQIDPNSKESEAIRSYIATRQAWNATGAVGSKRR